jgi:hypothetical protein
MPEAESILEEALKLPTAQRGRIAHELIRSRDAPGKDLEPSEFEQAWGPELDRRAQAAIDGEPGVDIGAACGEIEAKRRGGGR